MKKLGIFILLALLLTFWATPVYAAAPPALPHAFYGSVTITGVTTTPDGSQISATVDVDSGEIVATQNPVTTVGGSYGFNSPKLLVQGDITPGANITFYVNGYKATPSEAANYEVGGGPTEVNLTVAAVAPEVDTSSATSITRSRATLNGNLANLGTALSADVSFEWGRTTDYDGTETAIQMITSTGSFTAVLSGLSSNTTYHFRAVAEGHGPPVYGDDITFTTTRAEAVMVAPPAPPPGTTDVRGMVTTAGVFEEPVTATSDDELCTLTIPEDTVGLTEELEPLDEITILREDDPPKPPKDADIVLAYDLGPDGATFEPAITLAFSYDPADIPAGKDVLVVAYYDEIAEAWVYLEGEVDTVTNTITVSISHFTTFAVIGRAPPEEEEVPPTPAAFTVSSLGVSPSELPPDEEVNISVLVANTGGESGSYSVVLKINGVKEADKTVTIAAGSSRTVTFSVTREEADTYAVTVDGLSGSFTVVPVVILPEPAAFSVSYLSVSQLEVEPGELVTIAVSVANTGGESGSYTVVLKVNGVKEADKTVTIAAGDSQDVSFSVTKEEPGDYAVSVDGLSESFTVVLPVEPPGVNWPAIGGGIGGVVVVGLLLYFLVFRRRAYSTPNHPNG